MKGNNFWLYVILAIVGLYFGWAYIIKPILKIVFIAAIVGGGAYFAYKALNNKRLQ